MGRLATTSLHRRNSKLTGITAEEATFNDNLLKLRAVLLLLDAKRGAKMETARTVSRELQRRKLKASIRSLYFWRTNYLRSGFAGIARRRRSDYSRPQKFGAGIFARMVDAAMRVHLHGDLSREFRAGFQGQMTYETFRVWTRRIQRQLRVVEMPGPEREERRRALSL
jgi:hypothetical protein